MSPQFATRLSEACDARGLSDLGLAEAVGVPVTAVLGWLRGTDRPGPEDRHRLAEVLDVDPVWLETGEGTGPLVDIDRERAEYQAEAGWRFREVPEDGALDYGNANIWAFTPGSGHARAGGRPKHAGCHSRLDRITCVPGDYGGGQPAGGFPGCAEMERSAAAHCGFGAIGAEARSGTPAGP